eukprot:895925-Lingulodinium_polyedra.AAC.1
MPGHARMASWGSGRPWILPKSRFQTIPRLVAQQMVMSNKSENSEIFSQWLGMAKWEFRARP